jgi:hypothetical protein
MCGKDASSFTPPEFAGPNLNYMAEPKQAFSQLSEAYSPMSSAVNDNFQESDEGCSRLGGSGNRTFSGFLFGILFDRCFLKEELPSPRFTCKNRVPCKWLSVERREEGGLISGLS